MLAPATFDKEHGVPHEISITVSMPIEWQAGAVLTGVGVMTNIGGATLNDVVNTSDSFDVIATNAGSYDQLIAKFMDSDHWVSGLIAAFIAKVSDILSDPAALLHWTEHEWTMLHEWLRHIAIILIHLTSTSFH
jgi:hypothetical protein